MQSRRQSRGGADATLDDDRVFFNLWAGHLEEDYLANANRHETIRNNPILGMIARERMKQAKAASEAQADDKVKAPHLPLKRG